MNLISVYIIAADTSEARRIADALVGEQSGGLR